MAAFAAGHSKIKTEMGEKAWNDISPLFFPSFSYEKKV